MLRTRAIPLSLLLFAACATPPASDPNDVAAGIYEPRALERAPRLQGCGSYQDPPGMGAVGYSRSVRVGFVLTPLGTVEPGSARLSGTTMVPQWDQMALEAASQCVYTPGILNGEAVRVRVSKTFRFAESMAPAPREPEPPRPPTVPIDTSEVR